MHARAAAQLPKAGVGLVVAAPGLLAEGFETMEQGFVAAPRQAPVEKDVGRREDDGAIDVMLHLAIGQVADAHRPHAAIAGQGRDLAFIQHGPAIDAINRLQRAVAGTGGDIDDVAEVTLHGAGPSQPVQRADDVEPVTQPAIAVFPVAAAVR